MVWKKRQSETYLALHATISEIVYRHDPAGVTSGDGDNTDEYDSEAGTILPRLKDGATPADVRRILRLELEHWFRGVPLFDDRLNSAADEIWIAWTANHSPSG